MKKTAIIFFNLGGPDRLLSVRPFLFNLFNDPAITRLPQPLRFFLAKLISGKREQIAKEIYAKIGGGSPILANTERQAKALERILGVSMAKCFIAMRYWRPLAEDIIADIKKFAPEQILLLPLYPQFSTVTTQSSFASWRNAAQKAGLNLPTKTICCYPEQPGFIAALAGKIRAAYEKAQGFGAPRLLFSAHGLPEKIVKAGDPYPLHCARTVEALRRALDINNLDSVLCYQSRVGPLTWIGPSTDDEIRRAGEDKVPVVVAPVAFVSEHSETLVEIDVEYRHLAQASGVPFFIYSGAVGDESAFIEGLADLVRNALASDKSCVSGSGGRLCLNGIQVCPMEKD
jgi:protoporphyrin/coproporphyrin ferrochelatase